MDELVTLRAHASLLSEVMENAENDVLREKAVVHLMRGNVQLYRQLMRRIYHTEAAIHACRSSLEACEQRIGRCERLVRQINVLINAADTAPHGIA